MRWCWERAEWPIFTYINELESFTPQFLTQAGMFIGAYTHISEQDKLQLRIELLSEEALKTSKIEGELLDRDSIQISLCRQFGLDVDHRRIPPREQGVASMMMHLYQHFDEPLSHDSLFEWHKSLMNGREDIAFLGQYRQQVLPTQVVSGPMHDPKIHYEAPPSSRIKAEMTQFIDWFNQSAPAGQKPLSALIRAGIAHFYFVMIHPFEDGNGRIARALAEKALAQSLNSPSLIALAYTIERERKAYYHHLAGSNQFCDLTKWLVYFSQTILEAQKTTLKRVEFVIEKNKLMSRVQNQLNARQLKVLNRMFQEGIEGFKGGLSAQNYIAMTKTTKATATRDLQDLVEKSGPHQTGPIAVYSVLPQFAE